MFKENIDFFKCVEYYHDGEATSEDIESFENNYQLKLPEDYKYFLLK